MELSMEELRKLCTLEKIVITLHAVKRLEQRGIRSKDVLDCIISGEIIEQYPEDYPHPSCLILGRCGEKKPLHAVIGSNGEQLWIITAYYPSPEQWENDWKTRKERME